MSRSRSNNDYNDMNTIAASNVPMVRNVFFRRSRGCPLANVPDAEINYKNVPLLSRYVSERGRIVPSRISSISAKKQRKLAKAVKVARYLALMPFVAE